MPVIYKSTKMASTVVHHSTIRSVTTKPLKNSGMGALFQSEEVVFVLSWCHDTQHNDIQHKDTQYKVHI